VQDAIARRHRVLAALVACLLSAGAAFAQDDDPARAAEEAKLKAQLEDVRDAQRRLDAERAGTAGERADLVARLREDELAIQDAARGLDEVQARLVALDAELDELARRAGDIEARLGTQRAQIGALLRSAHAAGRHERLRIVFAPEQIGRIERALAYHRYLQRDRVARIDALRADLAALDAVRQRTAAARGEVAQAKDAQASAVDALRSARDARGATLAALERQLVDQAARLAALGRDERALLDLIGRLRDAIADIPKILDGGEPFASRRGRLPWPAPGRIVQRFGEPGEGGRTSTGVLIGAEGGAPVRAVSHGRVAFADWMAGFGLLLILDHGDGWMSLYAYNDALRAEVGDWVDAGAVIASAGSSGGRAEPGLYFELRSRGRPVDPAGWLARR
jgi:septal ring factor EnvC (AmiA/AmiB activator)